MTTPDPELLTPHPDSVRLGRASEKCLAHLAPWSGVLYRTTGIEYANRSDLLSGLGSTLHGARWTPKGSFPTAYGSLDPQSALLESLGTEGRYGIPYEERMPLVMVAVDVDLARAPDLTLQGVRKTLRVSLERILVEDWGAKQGAGEEALTQAVARLALGSGVQARFVPSARLKGAKDLVIFPETLSEGGLKVQNVEKLAQPKRG